MAPENLTPHDTQAPPAATAAEADDLVRLELAELAFLFSFLVGLIWLAGTML